MSTAVVDGPAYVGLGVGAPLEAPAVEPRIAADTVPLPAELLDGGEEIILALKPSLWFVWFDSFKWIVTGLVVVAGAAVAGGRMQWMAFSTLVQITALVVASRLGIGLLRWVSRFYVLTNRRVMRLRGVFRADVCDTLLTDILHTRVTAAFYERGLKLGTLRFTTEDADRHSAHWYHLPRAEQVHAEVRAAIRRALDRKPLG